MGLIDAISLQKAGMTSTTTANQVAIGGYYVSPGAKECFATQTAFNYGASTDVGVIVGTIETSPTTVDTDFTTAATFTSATVTSTAAFEQKNFLIPANAVNIRHKATISGGSPKVAVSAAVFLVKRSS